MLRSLPGILRHAVTDPGGRSAFVVVNVAVNLLFLARSYVAMVVLDYGQLGLVAVLQTVMALVASLHFGLLHGGYRLLCSASGNLAGRINALVYAFVAGFGVVVLVAASGHSCVRTFTLGTAGVKVEQPLFAVARAASDL